MPCGQMRQCVSAHTRMHTHTRTRTTEAQIDAHGVTEGWPNPQGGVSSIGGGLGTSHSMDTFKHL